MVSAVAVLLGAACLPVTAHAQEVTPIRFVLDWKFVGEHAQFTTPLEDGTFRNDHLAVTIERGNGSGDTVTKVASGAHDLGLADFYTMVRCNATDPDRKLIAVAMVQDRSSLGLLARSSIKTPTDLLHRRIASPRDDAGRQLFPLFGIFPVPTAAQSYTGRYLPPRQDMRVTAVEAARAVSCGRGANLDSAG